jgi:transcription elongation GreA/GreB family factor
MSRAFVRENDDAPGELPERALSEHPNYVTPRGLELLDAALAALERERTEAKAREDKATLARVERDQRYFAARRASARLVTASEPDVVRFGVRVVLALADGSERAFRLVGEDEADPAQGLISYVSPLAQSLLGQREGDVVVFQGGDAELVKLEA